LLNFLELGVRTGIDNSRIVSTLTSEFMIDHVVNVVEPLARIATEGVFLDKLCCRSPAELARQNIFHLVQYIVRMT